MNRPNQTEALHDILDEALGRLSEFVDERLGDEPSDVDKRQVAKIAFELYRACGFVGPAGDA